MEVEKLSQRGMATLVIVGIVIAVVVVAAVGVTAAVLLTGGGGGGGAGGGGGGTSVANASSLKFDFEATAQGQTITGTMWLKDMGTSNQKIRQEVTAMGQNMTIIVNGETRKAWMYMAGQWMDFSSSFEQYWDQYADQAEQYKGYLANWSGSGEYTYSDPESGVSIRIYNIEVNPALSDSLFTHS
ncbi:MAG: hypothetical protein QXG10_03135 [Candidatus Hadarchaeales archaeon]